MFEDNTLKILSNIGREQQEVLEGYNLDALSGIAVAVKAMKDVSGIGHDELRRNVLGIGEALTASYSRAGILEIAGLSESLSSVFTSTVLAIEQSASTQMMENIRFGLANSDLQMCLGAMQEVVARPHIEAADFAFLRTADLVSQFGSELTIEPALSRGLDQRNIISLKKSKIITKIYWLKGKMLRCIP